MTNPPNVTVDLLQERRLELGLPSQPAPWRSGRSLLLRGALLGGIALLIAVAVTVVSSWRGRQQLAQLQDPVAQRITAAETQLRKLNTQTGQVNDATQKIARQLTAFSGGSPLLEQLRRITPEGIQLEELSVGEAQIKLSGRAQLGETPGPLERINALDLVLSRLPITAEQGVKVIQITKNSEEDPGMTFSLDWDLNLKPLSPLQLQDLGADGLAERRQWLEQLGVPL